jgi:hypothetical protein
LALGDDIMIQEALDLAESVVVGKSDGWKLGTMQLRDWVQSNWVTTLNQLPSLHILSKGWFMLNF